MEVKVIFVGVGVLVIWHLFSGKNDKQLENLKSASALDSDLASLRDTLKNYKQEWATMKQKYIARLKITYVSIKFVKTNFTVSWLQYWMQKLDAKKLRSLSVGLANIHYVR